MSIWEWWQQWKGHSEKMNAIWHVKRRYQKLGYDMTGITLEELEKALPQATRRCRTRKKQGMENMVKAIHWAVEKDRAALLGKEQKEDRKNV